MKKQTLIIIIVCVLVAAVVALSVLGVIGPKGSFDGYTGVPTVSPPNTLPEIGTPWDQSLPTTP